MEIKLKQRLVGAMVLIALAIIFLPSLFHKDERVALDSTSLIPPQPKVESIVITAPVKPEGIEPAPNPDKAFQPPVTKSSELSGKTSKDVKKITDVITVKPGAKEKPASTKPKVTDIAKPKVKTVNSKTPKPTLNKQGIPNAWVVQVASLQTKERATSLTNKLQGGNYKAYTRSIKTDKGSFFRVFVGPYIDKSRALSAKAKLDKAYSVNSRVLTFSPE